MGIADLTEIKYVEEISPDTKEKIMRRSAYSLPTRPNEEGMTPDVIKPFFYQFVTAEEDSVISEINRIVGELNESSGRSKSNVSRLNETVEGELSAVNDKILSLEGGKLDKKIVSNAAYVNGLDGLPTVKGFSAEPVGASLVERDADGYIIGKTPSSDAHVATKGYVDEGLEECRLTLERELGEAEEQLYVLGQVKLDTTSDPSVVYATDGDGKQKAIRFSVESEKASLVLRDSNGYIVCKTPDYDSHVATKGYVDGQIATFDFIKVVETLPDEGYPNKIYFVPKADVQGQDLFDEYLWVNGSWEWIATKRLEVDLTSYATKQEVGEALSDKLDKARGVTDSVYALDGDGEHTTRRFTTDPDGDTLVLRSSDGYIYTYEPVLPYHVASKSYVDGAMSIDESAFDSMLEEVFA